MATSGKTADGKRRAGLGRPLALGLLLAVLGGGGGFWAVTRGPFAADTAEVPGDDTVALTADLPSADVVFVPLEPVVISLGRDQAGRHLMFTATLEVPTPHAEEVTHLVPRVLDVLNSYLRVVSIAELGEPTSLAVLRAQILRRVQVVTGPGRVRDLLVTQFVVN